MKLADYSKEDQRSLREIICDGAADPHIEYFLRCCTARKVDPFANLMYLQVRTYKGKSRPAVAMTIDGARMQASRTGQYAGSDEPEYDGEEGEQPKWCRATVYRMVGKEKGAFTAKIRWKEFVPAPPNDFQWKAKPYHMLGKSAEMQALRRAFPESVSDQSDEDFGDYDSVSGPIAEQPKTDAEALSEKPKAPSPQQWQMAVKAFEGFKLTADDMLKKVGKETLTSGDYSGVTDEDMETLRSWYAELERGEQTA